MKTIIFIAAVAFAGCSSAHKEGYSSSDTLTPSAIERNRGINDKMPTDRRNTDSTVNDVIDNQIGDSNLNRINR